MRLRLRKSPSTTWTLGFILVIALLISLDSSQAKPRELDRRVRKVALVDPLGDEDAGFSEKCIGLLEGSGLMVDTYTGGEVSVEMLRELPGDYRLIILRAHSTIYHEYVWFFTGEEYSRDKYVIEQMADEVHRARPSMESEYMFAVGADFVLQNYRERFKDTLIIMMGCDGLGSHDLAQAFIQCGASTYVSWDGPVSLPHTDEATLTLLEALLEPNTTLREAVEEAMKRIGPDPTWGSTLGFYPESGGSLRLG